MRAALLALLVTASLAAQSAPPSFEVASVKQNLSGAVAGRFQVPPAGTITYINVPLRMLIRDAYQVDAYAESYKLDPGPFVSIVGSSQGGPDPKVPRFDVQGKPPDNTAPAERRAMMRALLEDRFKLRVHREMRPMPVYALTVVREGRLGPKLAPSKFDCLPYNAQRRAGRAGEEPVDANGDSWCNFQGTMVAPGLTVSRFAGPITVLAQRLQPLVGRPITDATGLSGNFEWDLRYAWGPNARADAPEIFTALQEQLGLKLEARQAPVEVLVIDSVEMPTPD